MVRQLAVGILQLDVCAAAGEPLMQHRYCRETVHPLLQALETRPWWRVGLAIAGAGIEFLAEQYADDFALLRRLIEREQTELISTGYWPTVWPLFPVRDLKRNILLNREILNEHRLPRSRAYCADDGFFGLGVESCAGDFEYAICKDTYIAALSRQPPAAPVYRLGTMPVLVGAGNVLTHMARAVIDGAVQLRGGLFSELRLEDAVRTPFHSDESAARGEADGVAWRWYHMGPAHLLTSRTGPFDWEHFFFEPAWMASAIASLQQQYDAGGEFATPSELYDVLRAILAHEPPAFPSLPEAGWDPRGSAGISQWAGRHNRWQSTAGLLGLIWRARSALRAAEEAGALEGDSARQVWKHLLQAEGSRGLDASSQSPAAGFARQRAEAVLRECRCAPASGDLKLEPVTTDPWVQAEIIGVEGRVAWSQLSPETLICDVRFRQAEGECGVRFRRDSSAAVRYCPSGMDDAAITINLASLRTDMAWLPLANGVVSLGDNLTLIRVNHTCPVAAAVSPHDHWIGFSIEGAAEGRLSEWRFLIARGPFARALELAKNFNAL